MALAVRYVTPLLRGRLHWLRARKRITFKLFISLQGAEGHDTKLYSRFTCARHICFYSRRSPFSSPWRPRCRSYSTLRRQSCILRRRSCGVEQSMDSLMIDAIVIKESMNSLPTAIRTAPTLLTFKNRLKMLHFA